MFTSFSQQKIGLVLSGGGATGLAHIGVLKALEENNIPIDYITGTSAGAFIGSLYAAGYSPEEIEDFILSDYFKTASDGELNPNQRFLFRADDPNAKMIGIALSQNKILKRSLPTNFNSSTLLDYEMMLRLGTVSASIDENFDRLFVPFRCIASDIVKKKSVIFKEGSLNEAVRASMTYPFYYKPLMIDSVLLFDGGLYNNFPADVMYNNFMPDYIIGSNVSYNAELPDDDELLSQLTNMLVYYSDFTLPCDEGFLIEPEVSITTFDFDGAQIAIEEGYQATLLIIDSLKQNISSRRTKKELDSMRISFRSEIIPLKINSVSATSDYKKLEYSTRMILKKKNTEVLDQKELEKRYFRLSSSSQIDFVYPTLQKNSDSTYNLDLKINKAKEIQVDIGGHLSSRPVNTGYVGLSYQSSGRVFTKTKVESYFGKFYGSGKLKFTLELPKIYPISTSVYFTVNRWDYFRSFANFFEEVKPSFLVQREIYTGISFDHPIANSITGELDARWFETIDDYYQTSNFTNQDTTDVTSFNGFTASYSLKKSTLNRIQFASSGHFIQFKARYVYGKEHSTPGSTATSPEITRFHTWLNLNLKFQTFVLDKKMLHIGIQGDVIYNTHPLFGNYTATLLSMNSYSPIPDAKTYFLPEYRAPQYAGLGTNLIFTPFKNIDLRVDAFLYQPFVQINLNSDGSQSLSPLFQGRSYMASTSLIYHSFIGPIRVTANYFPEQSNPFAIQFSIGYVIFNQRANR